MIVWSGRGVLSILVLIASVVLFSAVLPTEQFDFALIAAFLITAAFSWIMGKKWNSKEPQVLIDKATGQELLLEPNHSLFWIKMQYWAFIFGGLAIVILVQQF